MIESIGANLDNLQSSIAAITEINNEFNGKLYAGKPSEEQQGQYAYIFLQLQVEPVSDDLGIGNIFNQRITFMIIGENGSSSDKKMHQLCDLFINSLKSTHNSWSKNFSGFSVHSITQSTRSPVMRDEKNRPRIQQDFIFYYIT